MNKYIVTTVLFLFSTISHSTGTHYIDPFELSLKGALFEPHKEYQILLKLNKEDRAITFLKIDIDGKHKIIPVKEFSHMKGFQSRTLVIGSQRGETKFSESSKSQTMHFGTFEFLVLIVTFESAKNCESGYREMNLAMKLSDLTYKINEYCLDEEDN